MSFDLILLFIVYSYIFNHLFIDSFIYLFIYLIKVCYMFVDMCLYVWM